MLKIDNYKVMVINAHSLKRPTKNKEGPTENKVAQGGGFMCKKGSGIVAKGIFSVYFCIGLWNIDIL